MSNSSSNSFTNNNSKLLKKKEKLRQTLQNDIYKLNDDINSISKTLEDKRRNDKNKRVASMRLITHAEHLIADHKKRPPDRDNDLRMYTQMDKDTWKYTDLRDWFTKYGPKQPDTYNVSVCDTGYMLRTDYYDNSKNVNS